MGKPVQEIPLRCRKCGSSGIAVWENLPPSGPSDERKLISLSHGFYQRPMVGTTRPEIICDHCGTGLIDEFMRQAGGTLSLESEVGTVARLALPANAAASRPNDERHGGA